MLLIKALLISKIF